MSLLPRIDTPAAYRAVQGEDALWLAALRLIAERHHLRADTLVRLREGTNVVFASDDLVFKLYPPHWAHLAAVERAVLGRLDGRLPVQTPRVYADGSIEGWSYLVMGRLPGTELHDVWPTLAQDERTRLVASLGELVAAVHRVPGADVAPLDAAWPSYVPARVDACVERHRQRGLAPAWLDQISAFLATAEPLRAPSDAPVIVTGDTHDYHLMVERPANGGGWRLCGLFDFDDARLGFREVDLAAAGLFLMSGQRQLLRTFLLAYGYPATELDMALSRRLLACTLLHPYREMTWVLRTFVDGHPSTLDELAHTIYRLN
jgi:hygromycin-B 7''-O-kinase